jgi:uncharacterized protein YkwD
MRLPHARPPGTEAVISFPRAIVLAIVLLSANSAPLRAREASAEGGVIDPAHFRAEAAARAVFEESNRQRIAAGLPALRPLPAAQTAAQWQVQFMAQTGIIGHVNTLDRSRRNIDDRARAAGIAYRFLAENVAMNFAVDYRPGRPFHTRRGPNGAVIYSYDPNGPPLPFHTYATLARTVVTQWMNSAGHRRNLLSREAEFLGCAAQSGAGDRSHGLGNIYCAQVFVALRQ